MSGFYQDNHTQVLSKIYITNYELFLLINIPEFIRLDMEDTGTKSVPMTCALKQWGWHSQIGGAFQGDKMLELQGGVYNFNIDESGHGSKGTDHVDPDAQEYFIMVGLFTSPQRIKILNNECEKIKNKYNFCGEIKYSRILPKMRPSDRKPEMMYDLLSIISDENLPIIVRISDRGLHRAKYPEPLSDHETTTGHMIWDMVKYLTHTGLQHAKTAAYVYQDNNSDEKNIKSKINIWRKKGFLKYNGSDNYERLIDYDTVESKNYIGIQLADICCGAVRELAMLKNIEYYNIISHLEHSFYLHPDKFRNTERGTTITHLIKSCKN